MEDLAIYPQRGTPFLPALVPGQSRNFRGLCGTHNTLWSLGLAALLALVPLFLQKNFFTDFLTSDIPNAGH